MLFSQRHGFKPIKTLVQIESMDTDLRNGLWSSLQMIYWDRVQSTSGLYSGYYLSDTRNDDFRILCRAMWLLFFKKPLDTLPNDWQKIYQILREWFFEHQWNEVYDFVEFVAQMFPNQKINAHFIENCNALLQMEVSGYRFVEMKITRIVAEEEIAAVEEALQFESSPTREHLASALQKLSDRHNPDYRNSIKESVSAVEALSKEITKSQKGTLGDMLKVLEQEHGLHPALKAAFSNLYGYTSDADGIRHALMDKDRVTFEQAKFMLVACCAFTNYVIGSCKGEHQ